MLPLAIFSSGVRTVWHPQARATCQKCQPAGPSVDIPCAYPCNTSSRHFRHRPNRRSGRRSGLDSRRRFPTIRLATEPQPVLPSYLLPHDGADPLSAGSVLTRDTIGTIARSLKSKTAGFCLSGNLRVVAILPAVVTFEDERVTRAVRLKYRAANPPGWFALPRDFALACCAVRPRDGPPGPGRTPLNWPEPMPSICDWPASIIRPCCPGVIGYMLP